jgi:4-hydroxy-2-oxoglutarate aldolase
MNLHGVFPPMATPFADDEVDLAAVRANVERYMRTGLRGVLVLGSNGEAAFLDEDEAERVVDAAREAVPLDRVLLVGTGRQSTRATIAACRRAARAGADAVLVLTPFFFKGRMNAEAFIHHYRAVADQSPVPVLIYNFTNVTGVNITPDTVATLADHPNIIGMKDSNGDMAQLNDAVARTPGEFQVLVGSAPTFFAALSVGAVGGILAVAGVIPDLCVKLYDLVQEKRYDEALALQRAITPLAVAVTAGFGVGGLKVALELVGYTGGAPRLPLLPPPDAAAPAIRAHLAKLGVL